MAPISVHIGGGDPSHAFYDQFSTIIRLESRFLGDHSEDVIGPARQRWVLRHQAEVAQAQGSAPLYAQDFVPTPAQLARSNIGGNCTPWYENFNLADQGIYNTASGSDHYPSGTYSAFNPAELAEYRAVVREQLVHSSSQHTGSQPSTSGESFNHTSDLSHRPNDNLPHSQSPSTPPNTTPRVRYPSTPPNRSLSRRPQISPPDSPPGLDARRTLRASTEPPTQPPSMGSLTAPDHYEPFEIYALEVKVGDYIQSVPNPGEVMAHYPCDVPSHQPTCEDEDSRPVTPTGGFRIQFKGADGTIRTKVFKGLDKVEVLREVVAKDNEKEVKEGGQ